jgi:hypothetical protein
LWFPARFVVLVSGTLVYSKGDSKEAEEFMTPPSGSGAAADVEAHQQQPPQPPPVAAAAAQPARVPRVDTAAPSAPIMMRSTPHSFKVSLLSKYR